MTTESPVTVRVTHRYTAPPERVFDAWVTPGLIERWMVQPSGSTDEIVSVTVDLRPGGRFSFVVRRDGEELNHTGEYIEVDRPRRLAFTWGVGEDSTDDSRVTLDFEPIDGGCEVTLTHEMAPQWAEYAERTKMGWTAILGAMGASLG
jgi:uncharacterized protein YndB with AHSA1/START domain